MENVTFNPSGDKGNSTELWKDPRKHPEDANLSVKLDMADELQKMGLPATAISRLLNINDERRKRMDKTHEPENST
jgi:hypothetical protein